MTDKRVWTTNLAEPKQGLRDRAMRCSAKVGLGMLALSGAVVWALPASASSPSYYVYATASNYYESSPCPGQLQQQTATCAASTDVGRPDNRQFYTRNDSQSFANLAAGALSAESSSDGIGDDGHDWGAGAGAAAQLFDSLTFSGPFSDTDTVTVTMTSTIAYSGDGSGFMELQGKDASDGVLAQAIDCANTNTCRNDPGFSFGNYTVTNLGQSYSISETFNLASLYGQPLQLLFYVAASSGDDGSASNNDPITITLPTGVTYTSASGLFLTDVGSAVPEPAVWASMILGFGLAGGMLRRRGAVKPVMR